MLPKWCVVIYKVVLDIERVVSYNEGAQRDNPSERNDNMDFGENLKKATLKFYEDAGYNSSDKMAFVQ